MTQTNSMEMGAALNACSNPLGYVMVGHPPPVTFVKTAQKAITLMTIGYATLYVGMVRLYPRNNVMIIMMSRVMAVTATAK